MGKITGLGAVEVSALEYIIPSQEFAFHGIRFDITSGGDYPQTSVAIVAISDAEDLLASLEDLASTTIKKDRFSLTEIELKIENLRIVLFNNDRDRLAFLVEASGIGSHFARQNILVDLHKLVKLAIDHLRTSAPDLI